MIEAIARLHSWSLDKTGTINMRVFNHEEILQQERIDIRRVSEEVLKCMGYCQGERRRG
jgi:hypothetical protein